MKLWILRPKPNLPRELDPWRGKYDRSDGFIVAATSEQEARRLADKDACDENMCGRNPWLNPDFSTCKVLVPGQEPGVIMCDLMHG